ncbi:hypothetical protein AVEN_217257-1, partial [Araneus ventricosus]
LQERD